VAIGRSIKAESDAVNALLIIGRNAAFNCFAVANLTEKVCYGLYRTEETPRLRWNHPVARCIFVVESMTHPSA
jgi:hypothetical protein